MKEIFVVVRITEKGVQYLLTPSDRDNGPKFIEEYKIPFDKYTSPKSNLHLAVKYISYQSALHEIKQLSHDEELVQNQKDKLDGINSLVIYSIEKHFVAETF